MAGEWWAEMLASDGVVAATLSGLGIGVGSTVATALFKNKVSSLKKLVDRKNREIDSERSKNQRYYDAISALRSSEDEVWNLHSGRPQSLDGRMGNSRLLTITVANLKGGVGKTTIAANLGAYFDRHLRKRVLLVDLDFQGSLSNTASWAAKITEARDLAGELIAGEISAESLWERARPLRPVLPLSSLIPAFYDLQRKENQLMVRWILEPDTGDVRFNMADLLYSAEVEEHFDVVIFDCPPRLSTATVCALAASKHLLIPTGVDGLSLDAVRTFLELLRKLKGQINPALNLAGVVLSLTQNAELTPAELKRIEPLQQLASVWGSRVHLFARNIPRIAAIANVAGRDFAYNTDDRAHTYFTQLGNEFCGQVGLATPADQVAAQ